MLLAAMAALVLSGCGELSRRTVTDEEVALTPDTIGSLAGDFRVMLNERQTFTPPSSIWDLIYDLEEAGEHPGKRPATFSIRFAQDKVWLTLKCEGKASSQVCSYQVVDNEVQLDVQRGELVNLILVIGSTDKAPGFGRLKDGRLWMRCRSSGLFILFFIAPDFPDRETIVHFSPIVLPDEPQISD